MQEFSLTLMFRNKQLLHVSEVKVNHYLSLYGRLPVLKEIRNAETCKSM